MARRVPVAIFLRQARSISDSSLPVPKGNYFRTRDSFRREKRHDDFVDREKLILLVTFRGRSLFALDSPGRPWLRGRGGQTYTFSS